MKNNEIRTTNNFEYSSETISLPLRVVNLLPHPESNIKYSCRIWDLLKALLKIFIKRGNIPIVLHDTYDDISGIKITEYHATTGKISGYVASIRSINKKGA